MGEGKVRDRDRDREKTGFWKSLFRSKTVSRPRKPPRRARSVSSGDAAVRRRRADYGSADREPGRPRRRPRHSESVAGISRSKSKGKHREADSRANANAYAPLTEWPPIGMSTQDDISLRHAQALICRGAPVHVGHIRNIPHAPDDYFALYSTSSGNKSGEDDVASMHGIMAELMTMRLQGKSPSRFPWETLEQPSWAFSFGRLPGTITLNHWVGMSSETPHAIPLRDPGFPPLREVDLGRIFKRLKEIEAGLEDDDHTWHRGLYKHFVRDTDKLFSMHKTLDRQITDLIQVLSKPEWIDFTNPKNQVVTRFIFDRGFSDSDFGLYHKFFHQLLLSLELDLRINSRRHSDWAKERLLSQIPPTLQWNIALARRWLRFIRIDGYGPIPENIKLRYRLRKRQIKILEKFAKTMKWPNLHNTMEKLHLMDAEAAVEGVSSDAMAFFSGLVLPGPTYPFLIMNTLIDIDPDRATDELALLTHLYPSCGFQYRSSYTYWTATSIVGKVIAPTCSLAAGWIGPGRPTPDLARSQIARIRSRRPRQRMTPDDVASMAERSDPLGPPADLIPVGEYKLVIPDPEDVVDTVRVERLGFHPVPVNRAGGGPGGFADAGPTWFDAEVVFAIDGVSWPLRLAFDVSFVSAWGCSGGPHPLFFDYAFSTIRADQIVGVNDWGGLHGLAGGNAGGEKDEYGVVHYEEDAEKVLVVEAFGVKDNEVLARAWCAHWGLSAVVADVRRTCVSCAVREAYAATLTVVILVDDQQYSQDDD